MSISKKVLGCKVTSHYIAEQGIELKVENWDKLYDKLTYGYWKEYAEEIRSIAETN